MYLVKTITKYCKQNRKPFTPAEKALRRWLLKCGLNTKFRTQRPFDFYIVDFLFPLKRIVVEVDGGYHLTEKQQAKDAKRTRYLESKGLKVVRIPNQEALAGNLAWLKELIESSPDVPITNWKKAYGTAAY